MAYQIDYAYTCHTGKVRANNEDNFWCCGVRLPVNNQGVDGILAGHTQHWQLPVLAVFDGMGGESCGEMAASVAAEALGGFYEENRTTYIYDTDVYDVVIVVSDTPVKGTKALAGLIAAFPLQKDAQVFYVQGGQDVWYL